MRVGILNVGAVSVTGKGRSLADMMETRNVGCCVCTRLDGRGTSRNSWGGCKLFRSGTNEQEWHGVGILGRPPTIQGTEGRPDQCEQEQ